MGKLYCSEQRGLSAAGGNSKMLVRQQRRDSSARRSVEEPNLNEERLVDLLDRIRFFRQRGREGVYSNGTTLVLLDDCQQELPIHFVEPVLINLQHLQRGLRRGFIDLSAAAHLSVIPHATQESIGNARGAA